MHQSPVTIVPVSSLNQTIRSYFLSVKVTEKADHSLQYFMNS